MKEIYLDHAATTKPLPCAIEAMVKAMQEDYGNPSSLHKKGIDAENIIKESNACFAHILGCQTDEIFYTSGGTESNNMAILGAAYAYHKRGKRVITTTIEHPSVREVFKHLSEQGFDVITLEVDAKGYISLEALEEAINDQTILVSIMHINNEIGTVQDIEKIGMLIKTKNPQTLFHVDAIQSFVKNPIHVKRCKIDLLSISAHKFHGPKGVGVLYKNKTTRLIELLYGGGQQKNRRSGTQNVPGIAGMHKAAEYMSHHFSQSVSHYKVMKEHLAKGLLEQIENCIINGPSLEESAPHILNVSFKNVRAEVLLHALEQQNIYVSSGSACSSNKKNTKGVLTAIGHKGEDLDNAIRFSFGLDTTQEAIDTTIEVLKTQITMLRKYTVGGKR